VGQIIRFKIADEDKNENVAHEKTGLQAITGSIQLRVRGGVRDISQENIISRNIFI
jgi:hypothetical protein